MNGGDPDGVAAGYAGDVSVGEAWTLLSRDPQAVLVDVRTDAEWTFVGVPDLTSLGKDVVMVPWQTFPGMKINPNFADEVAARVPQGEATLLFLCRSGARSKAAARAMTASGYGRCFNVAGGFEGDLDADRHRGRLTGWKVSGLPWNQG